MEKQIKEELDGRKAEEVEELNLDSCSATDFTGLTDDFVSLQTLSMTNNELTTLKGFPGLPNLRKLDLSDNKITSGFETLMGSPILEYLSLSGNPISDVSSLEPLVKLKSLQTLELFNTQLAEKDGYRDKVFALLEDVVFIDGFDRDGEPAPEDEDDYDDDEEGLSEEDDEEDSEEDGEGGLGEEGSEEDEEGSEEDEDESTPNRGTKRKHEDEENAEDA